MTSEGPARRLRAGRAFVALGVLCGLAALAVVGYAVWERQGSNAHEADAQAVLQENYDAAAPDTTTTAAPTTDEDATGSTPGSSEAVDVPVTLPGGVEEGVLVARFPIDGPALAMMQIPTIGLTKFVMRDVTVEALRDGPGHYRGTVRPGFEGNAAIAGHRTTFGAPFGRVDELQPGDEIIVSSRDGRFTYVVMDPAEAFSGYEDELREIGGGHVIVDPDDTWIVGDFGDTRLTLTSCHPENTSRDRIVVTAALVSEMASARSYEVFGGRDAEELAELVSEDLSELDAD